MALAVLLVAVAGLMAWVRLAPADAARWHLDLARDRPADMVPTLLPPGADLVRPLMRGGYADLFATPADAQALLARLDAIAMATPRTRRIAGSVAEGHITWETRSALWGFPDYTTAQEVTGGLAVYARLRFGKSDMGVNAARLRRWLSQI